MGKVNPLMRVKINKHVCAVDKKERYFTNVSRATDINDRSCCCLWCSRYHQQAHRLPRQQEDAPEARQSELQCVKPPPSLPRGGERKVKSEK